MCARNYKIKRWGSRIIMHATTAPGWKRSFGIGGLKIWISSNNETIRKIARYMRIRPEAVLQIVSDAFDESLVKRTVIVEDGCLRFETDIATIVLDPGEDGLTWGLRYKAKAAMINTNLSPHPKKLFVIPDDLFCGDVMFPSKQLNTLMKLIGYNGQYSVGTMDVLNHDYRDALITKRLACDKETLSLRFKTRYRTQKGQGIYAVVEPDYYDPIPNTWKLTHFYCVEDYT